MSKTPGITLTDESRELIVNLTMLDTKSREQKYLLFTKLLELWKQDLATGSIPSNAFEDNKRFIKKTILDSYDELDRNAENVYLTLYQGKPYTTAQGAIIPSNQTFICKAFTRRNSVNKRVLRQFTNLAKEFDDFVKNKGIYLYKARELTPIELPEPREPLPRNAKDEITYVNLAATDPDTKRKKGRKDKVNNKIFP